MQHKKVFFMLLLMPTLVLALTVNTCKQSKIPILISWIGASNKESKEFLERLSKDLSFSGQCETMVETRMQEPTKEIVHSYHKKYLLTVCIQRLQKSDTSEFVWRIYDTASARMLGSGIYHQQTALPRIWAHGVADMIWPLMTGSPGVFSTRLVFCKDVPDSKKCIKQLWASDFDGSHAELVLDDQHINVAPRWNTDKQRPIIFYSQYTSTNLQMRILEPNGNQRTVSNFEGVNLLPSFSSDGQMIVYCATQASGECHLYCYTKQGCRKIPLAHGCNLAPTITQQGEYIYYLSDAFSKYPQIYQLCMKTGKQQCITDGSAYHACPRYCVANNLLVYIKMVDGIGQLFIYDSKNGQHRQITSSSVSKDECSWSPCGNYILYAAGSGIHKQLRIFNRLNGIDKTILGGKGGYSYPDWSITYNHFPIFNKQLRA